MKTKMKKYKQLICSPIDGDCFRACVATILQLPIEKLPNPHDDNYYGIWSDFLSNFGLELQYTKACWINGYWIASVPSKNFKDAGARHAIVMKGTEVFFDPSPKKRYRTNRCLLGTKLVDYGYIFIVNDASKFKFNRDLYAD